MAPHLASQTNGLKALLIRGKYRIIEKIGQGAMGAVYKALHIRFNELRAIKVMMASWRMIKICEAF